MGKKGWIILAVVVVLLVFFIRGNINSDILDYKLASHTNIAMHIHPKLEIEILGEKEFVPVNLGIDHRGMSVIHTHDSSGELHVEAPRPHTFVLKDVFTLWGREFSSECIFNYCQDEDSVLEVFVNGIEQDDIENIPLRDRDFIKIVYRER